MICISFQMHTLSFCSVEVFKNYNIGKLSFKVASVYVSMLPESSELFTKSIVIC